MVTMTLREGKGKVGSAKYCSFRLGVDCDGKIMFLFLVTKIHAAWLPRVIGFFFFKKKKQQIYKITLANWDVFAIFIFNAH